MITKGKNDSCFIHRNIFLRELSFFTKLDMQHVQKPFFSYNDDIMGH